MTDSESARMLAEQFIDFQPRTSAEVRRRLLRAGYEPEIADEVVADLETAGLLDDARFSADWVESRSRRKGLGRTRLSAELLRKGVSREQTQEAVSSVDREAELDMALALARKRLGLDDPRDAAVRRKVAAYLQRRGYNWEIVEQVFSRMAANSD